MPGFAKESINTTGSGVPNDDAGAVESGSGWRSAGAALGVAAALWLVAWFMPAQLPIGIGSDLWVGLGRMIVRDSLAAGGVVAVGVAASCVGFRRGLRWERRFWKVRRSLLLGVSAAVAIALSAWISRMGLSGVPQIQDEAAIVFQSKNLLRGQLYAQAPPEELRPFFDLEYIVMDGPRWYGKYFIGAPLLLMPGVWLGVPWLVNPLLSGLAVVAFYWLGRELFGEKTGRVAAVLAALSPFRVGTFAFMMSHGGCLIAATVFALYLVRAARQPDRARYFVAAGAALGVMINFRPLTALALAVPLGAYAAWLCAWRQLRITSVAAFLVPVCAGLLVYFAYNQALTGDFRMTPFERWSPTDRLGFGPDRGMAYWTSMDRGHDLTNAIKNLYMNLDGLGLNLLGWGRVTLVLMAAALFVPAGRGRNAWMLAASAGPFVAYFFYHFSGVLISQPRYLSEGLIFMLLLAIGGLTALRAGLGGLYVRLGWRRCDARAKATVFFTVVGMTLWNLYAGLPHLADSYGPTALGSRSPVPQIRAALAAVPPGKTLVFMIVRGPEDVQYTLAGGFLNSPALDSDTIIAVDKGDEQNRRLIRRFPDRTPYRFVWPAGEAPRLEPIPTG